MKKRKNCCKNPGKNHRIIMRSKRETSAPDGTFVSVKTNKYSNNFSYCLVVVVVVVVVVSQRTHTYIYKCAANSLNIPKYRKHNIIVLLLFYFWIFHIFSTFCCIFFLFYFFVLHSFFFFFASDHFKRPNTRTLVWFSFKLLLQYLPLCLCNCVYACICVIW